MLESFHFDIQMGRIPKKSEHFLWTPGLLLVFVQIKSPTFWECALQMLL